MIHHSLLLSASSIFTLISLARTAKQGYCGPVKSNLSQLLCLGILVLPLLVSCRKSDNVVVTEKRVLTVADEANDSLIAVMPPEWRQLPGTNFRILNYRFGQDGEVFVGRSRGGVLPNANRWLGQFGKPAITGLDDLPKVKILGREGVLVIASGDFGGAMGRPARKNAGLAGVIVAVGDQLLTVKMMGDAEAVAAEQERLIQFCGSLRINEADSK